MQLRDTQKTLFPKQAIYAYKFEEKRYGVRDKLDYLQTTIKTALKREGLCKDFLKYLLDLVGDINIHNNSNISYEEVMVTKNFTKF